MVNARMRDLRVFVFQFCEPETLTSSIARSRLKSVLNASLRKIQIATSRLLTLRDCETTFCKIAKRT